jgi:glycosyltransferase involved in cell wall biosynthesis
MRILYIEPFDGGSHAAFTRALTGHLPAAWTVATLPGRHWKWRMRGAAPYFASRDDLWAAPYDLLFASSFLPLAELVGLRPDALHGIPKILYFHENQLAYPAREGASRERDLHYGFTQLTSALAADRCLFNSAYNLHSFLAEARALLRRMPDAIPLRWVERVEARAQVVPLPLDLPSLPDDAFRDLPDGASTDEAAAGPILLWNHRWEHDKDPDAFFRCLLSLAAEGVPFRVIVCGQSFRDVPPIFAAAHARLAAQGRVLHWGHAQGRTAYEALLGRAHIAVSTAAHEFFGVSMLEAAHFGALPLVPDRLAYRDLFPPPLRYASDDALRDRLRALCMAWPDPNAPLRQRRDALTAPFTLARALPAFQACFASLCAQPPAPARA